MSNLKNILLAGPTYTALSGEGRKAFIRQWIISGIIFIIGVASAVILLAAGGKPSIAIPILVILLMLQFVYALARGETIWQLRIREWKYRSSTQQSNKEELLAFADQLQRGTDNGKK